MPISPHSTIVHVVMARVSVPGRTPHGRGRRRGRHAVWPWPINVIRPGMRTAHPPHAPHMVVHRHQVRAAIARAPSRTVAAVGTPVARRRGAGSASAAAPAPLPVPLVAPRRVALRHLQDATVHLVLLSRFERRLRVLVRHGNESEPAGVARVAFRGDVAFEDAILTVKAGEEIVELVGHSFVGEVANVQLDGGRSIRIAAAAPLCGAAGIVDPILADTTIIIVPLLFVPVPLLLILLWRGRVLRRPRLANLLAALQLHTLFLRFLFGRRRHCRWGHHWLNIHRRRRGDRIIESAPQILQRPFHALLEQCIRRHNIQRVLERPHMSVVQGEHAAVRRHGVITLLDLHRAVPGVGVEERLPSHDCGAALRTTVCSTRSQPGAVLSFVCVSDVVETAHRRLRPQLDAVEMILQTGIQALQQLPELLRK
mmetsp:Transcript_23142/g.55816  ORF Transcript_23142/g.55816 Transcript_23142/m.55816 type:complete len:426 (+) Transcript_23142:962-2239(+)